MPKLFSSSASVSVRTRPWTESVDWPRVYARLSPVVSMPGLPAATLATITLTISVLGGFRHLLELARKVVKVLGHSRRNQLLVEIPLSAQRFGHHGRAIEELIRKADDALAL